MLQNSNTIQPKVVVIRRRPNQGFGFTLRHFIAYPPEDDPSWPETSNSYQRKAMETIFIKEVQANGPACFAGLQTGDRVLMVNNIPIAGISYSLIVSMIKQTPSVLTLHVVPKECDVLQMHYTIAHTPESNRLAKSAAITLPGGGGVAAASSATSHKSIHQQMISYPVGSSRSKQNTKSILSNEDYHEMGGRYSPLLMHGDSAFSRSKAPPNLSVLPRTAADNDLMIRLRESIKQKEEFLKSPLPHTQPSFFHSQQPMTMSARGQVAVKNAAKQPVTRDLLPASCDMQNFYAKNLPPNLADSMRTPSNNNRGDIMKTTIMRYRNMSSTGSSGSMSGASSSSSTMKDKFHKELEYLESLPEMGVTNQVFERKLVSTRAKGFDPFKPLTINTSLDGNSSVLKKPTIYDTVQQCVVDGQKSSRMEIYKANVASAGIDEYHVPNKYSSLKAIENHRTESKQSLTDIAEASDMPSIPASSEVVRRYKPINIDDNKPMRRISYLRATNNENEYSTDVTTTTASEISDAESKRTSINSEIRDSIHIENVPEMNGKHETKDVATEVEVFETEMEVKSSCIYGKRMSEYRSWRQVKIEIKGDILKIYSGRSSKSETNVIELDVRNFNIVDESADKKKYLFRLQSKPRVQNLTTSSSSSSSTSVPASGNADLLYEETHEKLSSSSSSTAANNSEHTEIVFKTKSATEMKRIFNLLQEKCNLNNSDTDLKEKQLAEPQKTAATTTMPTITYCDDNVQQQQQQQQQEYSPQSSTSRGGDIEIESISPVMKSRKSQHKNLPDKDLGSPKAKNWKDLLFRRNHGASADISPSTLASSSKTTGSIGVPLRTCPMSKNNEYVPLIVDVCTNIVETKGLGVIGIYRIPGNKAAISELKDQVNKTDFSWDRCNTDVRWEDVNVVSSLLKLFIRSLPDALLPSNFYNHFIEADKKIGLLRLRELKDLLHSLPPNSYETMKHLIRHLSRVSKNCHINLMEPKNLAIIFGPSIIRTPNETLEIAVKDMKHQCRIVELLLTQYDYFFEDGELPEIEANIASITSSSTSSSHQDQTSLLLDNVSKIERINDRESLTSRLIPHLRRRTHSKRSAVSSDTYSGESVLSLEYINKKASDSPPAATTPTSKEQHSIENASSKERTGGVEISILTDEESSNSRISDSGSMSLTTITDTLDSKLRNLRSGSESNDENGSPNRQRDNFGRRHTFGQPLILHENIPYADESPERHHHNEMTNFKTFASRNSAIVRDFPKNIRFSSVYEAACSDDSEGSTTSDPKEALIISSPSFFLERYKKRRDHRLFRSASFNCRNYSNRSAGGGGGGGGGVGVGGGGGGGGNGGGGGTVGCNNSSLTKDEKTDMNLTKKRQIQNKQNRSIKRRHTVGGPHDYTATTVVRRSAAAPPSQLVSSAVVVPSNGSGNNVADHVLEVGIRIKNVNRRY